MLVNWHTSVIKEGVQKVLCTGVHLDDNWVTVRASCTEKINGKSEQAYRVAIGYLAENPEKREVRLRRIRRIIKHPEFKGERGSKYNIALIQLTGVPATDNEHHPCIMSQQDLKQAIKTFRIGMATISPVRANTWMNWIDVAATKIKLAPRLCSSNKYICSRLGGINSTSHNIENAPIYVRYGIRDVDWGLAGLTTLKWRKTKSGRSVVHKHLPLYSYINWFEHVMGKDEKYRLRVKV